MDVDDDASPTRRDSDATPTDVAGNGTATEPTPGESGAETETRAEIEAIEQDVVDLRGLDLLDDLDEEIIDRQELARRVQEIIEEEYSPEEARVDALTFWLLPSG
ncbi:MAG: hypothetical protein R2849_03330 [Thermomicrobiales bacterium]